MRYWFSWWFPNRYVDFVQFGDAEDGRSRLWLGAHYATVHPDAVSVSDRIASEWEALAEATREWIGVFLGQNPSEAEHQLAQGSMIRTASTFRSADGTFYGFEGVQGALWPQIVSDVTGLAQVIPVKTIGASFGSAFLAAALEHDISIEEWNPPARICEPDSATRVAYDDLYGHYLALYPATQEITHALAQHQKNLTLKEQT